MTCAPRTRCALLADDDTRAIGIMKHLNRAPQPAGPEGSGQRSLRPKRAGRARVSAHGILRRLRGRTDATEACVGHTHIDVAWLWSLAQTRGKGHPQLCQRGLPDGTLSRIHLLCPASPSFTISSSATARPCMSASGRAWPRAGGSRRGGMWLEADCNMSSGESLVRQFFARQAVLPRCVRP